jgi:hypothetical protein
VPRAWLPHHRSRGARGCRERSAVRRQRATEASGSPLQHLPTEGGPERSTRVRSTQVPTGRTTATSGPRSRLTAMGGSPAVLMVAVRAEFTRWRCDGRPSAWRGGA